MQYTWDAKRRLTASGRRKDRGGGWPGVRRCAGSWARALHRRTVVGHSPSLVPRTGYV